MPETPPPWAGAAGRCDADSERAAEAERVHEQARAIALDAFAAHVPKRYREAVTDRRDIIAWARQYADDRERCPSLLLTGPTGTGKTHLAYAAVRAVAETGTAAYAWRSSNCADLYASLRQRSYSEAENELAKYFRIPLLFLDDLGAANLTGWTEEVTYRLINRRYEDCAPVIFTTNTAPTDFSEVFGARTASRVIEMTTRIGILGEDRRLRRPQ